MAVLLNELGAPPRLKVSFVLNRQLFDVQQKRVYNSSAEPFLFSPICFRCTSQEKA